MLPDTVQVPIIPKILEHTWLRSENVIQVNISQYHNYL